MEFVMANFVEVSTLTQRFKDKRIKLAKNDLQQEAQSRGFQRGVWELRRRGNGYSITNQRINLSGYLVVIVNAGDDRIISVHSQR